MRIDATGAAGLSLVPAGIETTPTSGTSLSGTVSNILNQVNTLQTRADGMAGHMALGDVRSVHAVMIASEEASVALSAVLQVRNKAVESYQEIMRMQV